MLDKEQKGENHYKHASRNYLRNQNTNNTMANNKTKKESLKMAIGSVSLKDAGHSVGALKFPEPSLTKDNKFYPSVYVSTKDVPGLEGYEAGDYVTLVVYACVRNRTVDENKDGKKCEDFRLDLEKIGVVAAKSQGGKDHKEIESQLEDDSEEGDY